MERCGQPAALHRNVLPAGNFLLSVVPPFPLLLECRMAADHSASSGRESDPLFADVIVPRHLAGPFTYRVPIPLKAVLRVGHLVLVPFGRSVIQGAVISLTGVRPSTLAPEQLKEIRTLATNGHATEVPANLLQLAKRVAESYVAPWGQCLRLVMPPRVVAVAANSRFLLTQRGRDALAAKAIALSDARHLLQRLKKRPLGIKGVTLRESKDRVQAALLESLVDQEWIHEVQEPAIPRSRPRARFETQPDHDLYSANIRPTKIHPLYPKDWEERIVQAIEQRRAAQLLIQAPAPQRLALLREAIRRTVGIGRTVLVIVGEAERAESLTAALSENNSVVTACLHSGLSEYQKADVWQQIREQRIHVVIGTRSAVFLPLPSLGLIWIERDEDPALKEPQEPRFHAREVAWLRAQEADALFIAGSAHLSLETLAAVEKGAQLLQIPLRREGIPRIEVVDLRGQDRATILSPLMVEATREALARRAGVLLFLNRKGYAGALICRDCGQAPRCPSCRVAIAYYRQKGSLLCPYCGMTASIPDLCPSCAGPRLRLIGEGTERVEEDVKRLFPQAAVLRIDGETMQKPKQAAALWDRIQQKQWDILVGTQLLLRDDVVPTVGFVGVVQADAGLSLPDFRAAERTYHLLTDAVGFAQPSSSGGRVIIQSYLPSHHAIQAIVQQDETIFRTEELAHRTTLGYPPAVHLIVLHISGSQEKIVQEAASAWVTRLRLSGVNAKAAHRAGGDGKATGQAEGLTILGPVPSPVPKLRGRYRRQILIKSHARDAAAQAMRKTVEELEQIYPSRLVKFDVDVDPLEMW
jgi:primosomal protein N' (replication factor Y) (superfamily II helicase)